VAKRWLPLTVTTVVSHLALWLVLLLTLRHVGVSEQEVSWAEVLAVFAFARLLSAAPITPGGLGFVELALIGGLYAAGKSTADVPLNLFRVQIAAAVLLYRGPHLRSTNPARRFHLPDLAAQGELAKGSSTRGAGGRICAGALKRHGGSGSAFMRGPEAITLRPSSSASRMNQPPTASFIPTNGPSVVKVLPPSTRTVVAFWV
jgi:hypothetical protein